MSLILNDPIQLDPTAELFLTAHGELLTQLFQHDYDMTIDQSHQALQYVAMIATGQALPRRVAETELDILENCPFA